MSEEQAKVVAAEIVALWLHVKAIVVHVHGQQFSIGVFDGHDYFVIISEREWQLAKFLFRVSKVA